MCYGISFLSLLQTFNRSFLEFFPFTQTTLIYLLKTHDVLTHGVLCFAIKILNCF